LLREPLDFRQTFVENLIAEADRSAAAFLLACLPIGILHVAGKDIPFLRLSFGGVPLEDIDEGIGILSGCIRAARTAVAAGTW